MRRTIITAAALLVAFGMLVSGQSPAPPADLGARVAAFLEQRSHTWRDLNVPESDGQLLHDLVVKGRYTRALEIGTSTGRSGIWIGLALSKTGGRLVTIDIDADRHAEAVRNFKESGVAPFIDARLADAHELVPRLEGPFDFVFIDADKDWYTNYAKAVVTKLAVGGCIAAHNVYPGRGRRGMTGDYLEYMQGLAAFETTVTPGGVAISYRRK
jgi:predicted O-methyltransferase YrrM